MFAPVFAALLALSDSPSPEPSPSPTPPAQTENRVSDAEKREHTPVAQAVIVPTKSAEQATHQRDNRDDKSSPDNSFKWGMLFTAVIAVSAVVGAIYHIHQVVIARRQWRATQESAAAAIQSAQTQRISNRARVVIEKLCFEDVGDDKVVRYEVRNIGKTIAHIYERLDTVQMIDSPLPDRPPALESVAPTKEPFDLAPDRGDVSFGGGILPKSGLNTAKFVEGKAEFYARGVIKYRDDFGEWTTPYTWQHRRNGPAFPVRKAGYNEAT
jgi:hypothetical protein